VCETERERERERETQRERERKKVVSGNREEKITENSRKFKLEEI
jgi:hypothetical protein